MGNGGYLAFLGRICPEKGIVPAIQLAENAQIPLRIAAKVDLVDQAYHRSVVEPMLAKSRYAHFVGEINETQKQEFLGNASALLFPIDWPEPFGMVMIEAMACGTPVIAYDRGSVSEIIENNVTGYVLRNPDLALQAIESICLLDRTRIRAEFERRFVSDRMAADYFGIYESVLSHEWSNHLIKRISNGPSLPNTLTLTSSS
jgi:glycosyltransferase involved in cell wall biosynthesis